MPNPVRSGRLNRVEPGQYFDGRPQWENQEVLVCGAAGLVVKRPVGIICATVLPSACPRAAMATVAASTSLDGENKSPFLCVNYLTPRYK